MTKPLLNPKALRLAVEESSAPHFLYLRRWDLKEDSWHKIGMTGDWNRRDREQNVLPTAAVNIAGVCLPQKEMVASAERLIHEQLSHRRVLDAFNREVFRLSAAEVGYVCQVCVELQAIHPASARHLPALIRHRTKETAKGEAVADQVTLSPEEHALWLHISLLATDPRNWQESIRGAVTPVGTIRSRQALRAFEAGCRDRVHPRRRAFKFNKAQLAVLEQASQGRLFLDVRLGEAWRSLQELRNRYAGWFEENHPELKFNGRKVSSIRRRLETQDNGWPLCVEKKLHAAQDLRGSDFPYPLPDRWVGAECRTSGTTTLLEFWATWSAHSRELRRKLEVLAKRFTDELIVIGVSNQCPETRNAATGRNWGGAVEDHLKRTPCSYPQAIESSGGIFERAGIRRVPYLILIDSGGTTRWQGIPDDEADPFTDETVGRVVQLSREI